jgi:dephospho-CoA kinase
LAGGEVIVGLTGGPGAGKTAVANILKEKGAIIISGDEAGRQVIEQRPVVIKRLIRVFGKSIIGSDGTLDRGKLGEIVFSNLEALHRLNKIVHPPLLKIIKADLNRLNKPGSRRLLVIDAALIFEWGIADWCDYILVVTAKRETRLKRMISSGLAKKDALNRIRSQMPEKDKAALADYVIENNDSKANLRRKVELFLRMLQQAK